MVDQSQSFGIAKSKKSEILILRYYRHKALLSVILQKLVHWSMNNELVCVGKDPRNDVKISEAAVK